MLLVATALAADGQPAKRDITLDDYFTLAFIAESAISPNGEYVAYADARWQLSTNDRKADLWVAKTATGEASRLTFDRTADRSLTWSGDSKYIYFLRDPKRKNDGCPPRDLEAQVWPARLGGGEPLAITPRSGRNRSVRSSKCR